MKNKDLMDNLEIMQKRMKNLSCSFSKFDSRAKIFAIGLDKLARSLIIDKRIPAARKRFGNVLIIKNIKSISRNEEL